MRALIDRLITDLEPPVAPPPAEPPAGMASFVRQQAWEAYDRLVGLLHDLIDMPEAVEFSANTFAVITGFRQALFRVESAEVDTMAKVVVAEWQGVGGLLRTLPNGTAMRREVAALERLTSPLETYRARGD